MAKIGIPQIHIVPFDLGVIFFDVLAIDNSKNLLFADYFCEKMKNEAEKNKWKFTKLFDIIGDKNKWKKSPLTIKFKRNDFADNAICRVELNENLYCYFLESGIAIFQFIDLNCDAMRNVPDNITKYSKALIANYQKKVTQSTILDKADFEDVCPEIEREMLKLRIISWQLVTDAVKHHKIKHLRQFSGNINYKAEGLSYVLTIYLFEEGELLENECNHLLCSSIFGKVVNPERWDIINNDINKIEPKDKPYEIDCGTTTIYASWSAVAAFTKTKIHTIDDIRANDALTNLIKVEAYVQSRWFMADNSMDNVNKNSTATMESLQRIASLMEFCQAELDNEISANMGTLQKNLLKIIVDTSEVRKLYKSVLNQIKTQLKIKEAHYEDKKRKNRLIADLLLAIFTAASLYKTVLDLVVGNFGWWNWLIFIGMMFVAIGTILFNYINR